MSILYKFQISQSKTDITQRSVTENQYKKLTKRQLKSPACKLNWASQWHHIHVNKDRRDGDGVVVNLPATTSPIWTDICPVTAGCVNNGRYLYTPFDTQDKTADLHINYKETMALEPAVTHWAPHWTHLNVMVYCNNNQAAVGIINTGICHDPVVMAGL